MATVNKDFRIKNGLVVEGATATVNGSTVLTEASTEFLQDTLATMATGGTQTNISVTYNDETGVLNFVAENGVADSTTDNLVEGSTNKYYTDERVDDRVADLIIDGTGLDKSYNDGAGTLTLSIDSTVTTNDGAQTLTNKTLTSPTVSGLYISDSSIVFEGTPDGNETTLTVANPTADRTITLPDATTTVVGTDVSQTLTNKTIAFGSNTISGTLAEFNTAVTDADLVSTTGSETLTNKTLGTNTTLSANLNADNHKITNVATPTADADAATKAYVDAQTAGLNVHDSVRVASYPEDLSFFPPGGNIDLATELEAGDELDGVTLVAGDRVLVKNQTTASQNGIYVVQASGAAVRASDYNSVPEVDAGDFIFVEEGTKGGKTGWVQQNVVATLGTDPIEFTQFSGAGTYLAGNGLTLTGTTFSIDTAITVDIDTPQTLTSKTLNTTSYDGLTIAVAAPGTIYDSDGNPILGFEPRASAVSNIVIGNGAESGSTKIKSASATETDVDIDFIPQGAGWVSINSADIATVSDVQTLTNKTLTSPTVSGLYLSDSSIVFEGSSSDSHQTTLDVVNPTADRTITLPNVSGTVVTTGDTGSVTSTMIADGTIVDGDINTSAGIVDTKLATISTADKVSLSALNIDGATDIGADLADADLLIVDDGGAGTNRKSAMTRIPPYVFGKISGDITIASNGTASITANSVALGTDTTGNYIATITGTSNQVTVTGSGTEDAAVTLSLPQNIDSGSSPTFAGINLGSVTLTDALIGTAVTNLTTTSATVVDSWSAATYNSAKYIVQIKKGTDIQVLEVLVTVDGNNNVYLTEYADVISNASIGTTDADYSSGNVRLLVTASSDTTVKVHKTLIEA